MAFTSTYALEVDKAPFVANTYTPSNQNPRDQARLGDGGFAIAYDNKIDFYGPGYTPLRSYEQPGGNVWALSTLDDGSLYALFSNGGTDYVRHYDALGNRIGASVAIAPTIGGGQYAKIEALADGGFAHVYSSSGKIYVEVYSADLQITRTTQVSTDPRTIPYSGEIVRLNDGGFAITHGANYVDGGDDIFTSVYNADGSVRTADHAILGVGSDARYTVFSVTQLQDGGYAVLYEYYVSNDFGDDDDQVVLRTYDASGTETNGPRIIASHDPVGDAHVVTLENGFLAVSWAENDITTNNRYYTILDADGLPSAELPSRVFTNNADLAALGSGVFLGVGVDLTGDGSGQGVSATVRELVRTSIGTEAADVYLGDALADKVYGHGGADFVAADAGRDTVYGEAGEDFLRGGGDGDYLYGGTEADGVYGDDGDDVVSGDEGNDTVEGGAGNDIALGGTDNDIVNGNDGDDLLYGESGADALDGGIGKDRLEGGGGFDTLTGGAGDDTYILVGLASESPFPPNYKPDAVVEASGRGVDIVYVQSGVGKFDIRSYTLTTDVENGAVTGVAAFTLTGNKLANVLTGNDAANTLDGGKGVDTLAGAKGDDTYVLGEASGASFVYDTVIEAADGGIDTVFVHGLSARGYKLTANVENGTITGPENLFQLEGNELANTLTGGGTSERLIGGAGNDRLVGKAGFDTFIYQDIDGAPGGWGKDTITDFARGADKISFIATAEVTRFRDLQITDDHGNALISTGHGDTIRLLGVAAADLTAGDFTFVRPAALPVFDPGDAGWATFGHALHVNLALDPIGHAALA